jgi:hypothetical protein
MRNFVFTLILIISSCYSEQLVAQTYNPYVQNIQFQTAPTANGFLCGSYQVVQFNQGISTAANATLWQTNPMTISICLTGFVFEGSPASIISGTYASNFNWTIDAFAPNCLVGVQNQTLFGIGPNSGSPNPLSSGQLTVNIKVPENMPLGASLGVNVNLQLPGYMTNGNISTDDQQNILSQSYCTCYSFITDGGTIGNNQTFLVGGNPQAFTSISAASGGVGGVVEYQWQELISNVWTDIGGATNSTYDAGITSTTTSYRRKAKRSICGTWVNSNIVQVTITNAGPDKSITCTSPTTTIGLPALAGHSYAWSPTNGLSNPAIAQPLVTATANTNYTLTLIDPQGNNSTDHVFVTIDNSSSIFTVNASASTICESGATTLSATTSGTNNWMPGGLTGTTITVSPAATTTYTVTNTNTNGCISSATKLITVHPKPNVGSTASVNPICSGSSTQLSGTGANIYTWNFGGNFNNPITVSPSSTTTYAVIGTNTTTGCTNIAIRVITVLPTPNVTTTATNTSICSGTSTTLNANGATSYIWQPGTQSGSSITVSPTNTTTYTVTGTNTEGCTKTSTRTITVTPCSGTQVSVKLFIEGYFVNANGSMKPVLQNQSVAGATSTNADSVTISFHQAIAPYTSIYSVKTILQTNGMALCALPINGNYYIAVKHRNAIETWSAASLSFTGGNVFYDFSNAANKAYGNNQKQLQAGIFAFYSGDLTQDENIDLGDFSLLDADISNFEFGYRASDLNGDGNVDLDDVPFLETNINAFIFANKP